MQEVAASQKMCKLCVRKPCECRMEASGKPAGEATAEGHPTAAQDQALLGNFSSGEHTGI